MKRIYLLQIRTNVSRERERKNKEKVNNIFSKHIFSFVEKSCLCTKFDQEKEFFLLFFSLFLPFGKRRKDKYEPRDKSGFTGNENERRVVEREGERESNIERKGKRTQRGREKE